MINQISRNDYSKAMNIFLLSLIVVFMVSCDGVGSKGEESNDSAKPIADSSKVAPPLRAASVDGLLDILFMERDEFLNLPSKRLVFQFCIPDTGQTNTFNLAVYLHNNLRYNPATPVEVLHNSWLDSETDITDKKVFLGHGKLRKQDVDKIKADLNNNISHLFVIFYPELVDDHIVYRIYTKESITLEAMKNIYTSPKINPIAYLNPSPPASDLEN